MSDVGTDKAPGGNAGRAAPFPRRVPRPPDHRWNDPMHFSLRDFTLSSHANASKKVFTIFSVKTLVETGPPMTRLRRRTRSGRPRSSIGDVEARRVAGRPRLLPKELAAAHIIDCRLWPWRHSGGRTTPITAPTSQRQWQPRWAKDPRGSAPPTPPYVRVRIRRFEKLR
jgi:hypothetical protein